MNAWRVGNMRRTGLSLVEMMAATTIMATLMVSVVVLVRSGYGVWNAYEEDVNINENAYGVLRHVVRQLRQADSITVISPSSDTTGNLSFLTASVVTKSWSLDGAQQVWFNDGTSNYLLANSIDQLIFVGYEADGVTATTVVSDIHLVKCTVQVTLPHGAGVTQTVSCKAWIRSW